MNHVFKISAASLLLCVTVVSCSKDSSPAPAPVAAPGIVAPLSTMQHRPTECPIPYTMDGRWVSRGMNGQPVEFRTYRFENGRMIESRNNQAEMIYDGVTRSMQINQYLRLTYVGGCEQGKLRTRSEVTGTGVSIVSNSTVNVRDNELVIKSDVFESGQPLSREREIFVRPRFNRRRY